MHDDVTKTGTERYAIEGLKALRHSAMLAHRAAAQAEPFHAPLTGLGVGI
jgi:hypothetical protein